MHTAPGGTSLSPAKTTIRHEHTTGNKYQPPPKLRTTRETKAPKMKKSKTNIATNLSPTHYAAYIVPDPQRGEYVEFVHACLPQTGYQQ